MVVSLSVMEALFHRIYQQAVSICTRTVLQAVQLYENCSASSAVQCSVVQCGDRDYEFLLYCSATKKE